MSPCKHLDYETDYGPDITLEQLPDFPGVQFWRRGPRWTDGGNPRDVQFCKLRGRINGIFQCHNPGEMPCYEPENGSEVTP